MRARYKEQTAHLSGGEQQVVAIGRALVANPRVLLLDEISLGLAPVVVKRIYETLPALLETDMAVLVVEQDVAQALRVADRFQCLLEGRTTLEGKPSDYTAEPGRGCVLRIRIGGGVMVWVNAIVQGLMLGGLFALFACGLSLLFGVVGVINLAHGDLAVLGAYVAVALLPSVHTNALWALLFVPPIFAVFGYGAQRTILQRSLDTGPLTTLLVTFGLSVVIQNALLEGFSADSHSLSIGALATKAFHPADGVVVPYLRLAILLAAVAVLGSVQLVLRRTSIGRQIRAVADDAEAASVAGVSTRHITGIAAGIAFADGRARRSGVRHVRAVRPDHR